MIEVNKSLKDFVKENLSLFEEISINFDSKFLEQPLNDREMKLAYLSYVNAYQLGI